MSLRKTGLAGSDRASAVYRLTYVSFAITTVYTGHILLPTGLRSATLANAGCGVWHLAERAGLGRPENRVQAKQSDHARR